MDIVQVVALALIRGLAEFLPVNADGHLLVTSRIIGWADQGLTFDVAVAAGTLLAVIAYFWRDVGRMIYGLFSPLWGRAGAETRLVWTVIVGTIPLLAAGYLLMRVTAGTGSSVVEDVLADPIVIGAGTIALAIVLWLADVLAPREARLGEMGLIGALFIGLAQVLALLPGTGRTGMAIAAARLLGYDRDEAARFALLLSIPAIAVTGVLAGKVLLDTDAIAPTLDGLIGVAASFAAALVGIALMMAWLRQGSYLPFVIYRILFGAFLIYWFYAPAGATAGG